MSMNQSQQIFAQEIRFKDENGKDFPDWEERKLGEYLQLSQKRNKTSNIGLVLSVSNKKGFIAQTEQFGDHRVASRDVLNYRIVEKGDFAYNPSRINIGSIACLKNFDIGIVSPMYVVFKLKDSLDKSFFESMLKTHYFNYLIKIGCSGSVRDTLNFEDMAKFKLKFPDIKEQQKVASFLESIDYWISNLKSQKESLEKYKKGIMQKIFAQEIRFKDENGKDFPDWEEKKINDIVLEKNKKSITNNQFPILSSSMGGIYLQSDYFNKQTASQNNIGYKIIEREDFVYRSMSDTGYFTFNLQNLIDIGIVSPAYPIFKNTKDIESKYLFYVLNNDNYIKKQILILKEGGTRFALSFSKFAKLKINIPSLPEQQKIASFLSSLDDQIQLKSQQIEKAEQWKKGLMQGLFV
jgi:type I restriction enzyme S subunit